MGCGVAERDGMTAERVCDGVELYAGDCLDVLRAMPAGSVDAVVTDPPYGQTNERYDGRGVASLAPDVWAECYRVCGPDAALVAFAGSPTYHRIASAVEAGGWRVRQMWAWVYRDGMITSAYPREGFDRLAPAMDPIVYATKGKVLLDVEREGEPWAATRNTAGYSERAAPDPDGGGRLTEADVRRVVREELGRPARLVRDYNRKAR